MRAYVGRCAREALSRREYARHACHPTWNEAGRSADIGASPVGALRPRIGPSRSSGSVPFRCLSSGQHHAGTTWMAPASMAIASCSPYVTIVAWSMLPARMEVSQGTKAAPACDRFLRRLAHLERVRGPARQGVALHEVGLERRRTVPHRIRHDLVLASERLLPAQGKVGRGL